MFDAATASLVQVGRAGGPDRTTNSQSRAVGAIWTPTATGGRLCAARTPSWWTAGGKRRVADVVQSAARRAADVRRQHPARQRGDDGTASGLAPVSVNPTSKAAGCRRRTSTSSGRSAGLGVMVGYFGSQGDRLRIAANVNQPVNGVRPFPRLSPSSPILPGSALVNITEATSLGGRTTTGCGCRPTSGRSTGCSSTRRTRSRSRPTPTR